MKNNETNFRRSREWDAFPLQRPVITPPWVYIRHCVSRDERYKETGQTGSRCGLRRLFLPFLFSVSPTKQLQRRSILSVRPPGSCFPLARY